jgi:putative transposase
MRKSRFTQEQIAYAMKQVEVGVPVAELCRKMGVSKQTFYVWKKKYAGMGIVEVRRVKQLEDENRRDIRACTCFCDVKAGTCVYRLYKLEGLGVSRLKRKKRAAVA